MANSSCAIITFVYEAHGSVSCMNSLSLHSTDHRRCLPKHKCPTIALTMLSGADRVRNPLLNARISAARIRVDVAAADVVAALGQRAESASGGEGRVVAARR